MRTPSRCGHRASRVCGRIDVPRAPLEPVGLQARISSSRRPCTVVRAGGSSPPDPDQQPGVKSFDDYDTWPATAPPPRRLIVGSLTALGIALGGNLGGITSGLLGLDGGKFAALLKLDALIPIAGSKRCIGEGYEFVYPAKWLADVTLYRRRIESAELQRGLAFQQFEQQERVAQRQRAVEPAVAFGPQGSTGEDNISVIAASSPGLVLENLGSPEQVAEFLLDKRIARPGSGYAAELLRATSRDDSRGQKYYELEYQVKREGASGWRRHNISVLCAKEGVLYTLNAQSSADKWELYASQYRLAADSFALR